MKTTLKTSVVLGMTTLSVVWHHLVRFDPKRNHGNQGLLAVDDLHRQIDGRRGSSLRVIPARTELADIGSAE